MEPLLTTEEVAEYFKVDVVTVRRLISRGELTAYRIGSEFRLTQADLDSYLKLQRVAGSEPSGAAGEDPEIYVLGQMTGKTFTAKDMNRFDKFTERARKVLTLAQQEAVDLKHNYIGTEHLLLGLVREGEGVAVVVLTNLGVELSKVRNEVEAIIGQGKKDVASTIGLTPRAKKAIELAMEEARYLGHHYIGTEHMLLGLVREGEGIAAKVLTDLGLELLKVRVETLRILNEMQGRETNSPPVPEEATALVPEGQEGKTCNRCHAQNPEYFHYCFNCGKRII
jgi:excisionase family DNA binding protein